MTIQLRKPLSYQCKHTGCGGVLIRDWPDDIVCLQCGRPHNENGELVLPKVRDKKPEDVENGGRPSTLGIANRGGRPRLKMLDEIRQRQSLEAQNKNNGGSRLPNDIKKLREMWRLRNNGGS